MQQRRANRGALALALAVSGLLALSACTTGTSPAGSGEGDVCVEVDTAQCVGVSEPINIAYFASGLQSGWGQANADAAKATAEELGAQLTVFDGAFDANQQFQLIQQALSSGQYNGIALVAGDSDLVCQAVSETAPSQGIITVANNQPLCGTGSGTDTAAYAPPGTLSYVGAANTTVGLTAWFEAAAAAVDGPQKVAVISGPEPDNISKRLNELIPEFADSHPDWEFVTTSYTDWSTAGGFAVTQDLLNAHPDLTLVLSAFSDISIGAANAVDQAGAQSQVKIVDLHGNQQSIDMVCAGSILLSVPAVPATEGSEAVKAIVRAIKGESVDRFISTEQEPLTGESACGFKAES